MEGRDSIIGVEASGEGLGLSGEEEKAEWDNQSIKIDLSFKRVEKKDFALPA